MQTLKYQTAQHLMTQEETKAHQPQRHPRAVYQGEKCAANRISDLCTSSAKLIMYMSKNPKHGHRLYLTTTLEVR